MRRLLSWLSADVRLPRGLVLVVAAALACALGGLAGAGLALRTTTIAVAENRRELHELRRELHELRARQRARTVLDVARLLGAGP